MSESDQNSIVPPEPKHPLCPICGVPMWVTFVEHIPGKPLKDRLHYECRACEAKAVLPRLS